MFPVAGSGSKRGPPIFPHRGPAPTLPHPLDPHHERNLQFHLCDYLSQCGTCYPEVDFGDGPIDIVWVDDSYEGRVGEDHHRRTIGIETKREPNISTPSLREQVTRYASTDAYSHSDFVADGDESQSADDFSLLDGVWIATPSDDPYETGITDGQVAYNRWTGRVTYDISENSSQNIRRLPYHEYAQKEAVLGLLLWQNYRGEIKSPEKIVSAEVRCTRPHHRHIRQGQLKTQKGENKRVDLVVGDLSYRDGFSVADDIVGLELKAGTRISDEYRTVDQLETYIESGLFSEVYLTVTRELFEADFERLERVLQEVPQAGLREVALDQDGESPRISSIRDIQAADRLAYNRVPIVSYGGRGADYHIADETR